MQTQRFRCLPTSRGPPPPFSFGWWLFMGAGAGAGSQDPRSVSPGPSGRVPPTPQAPPPGLSGPHGGPHKGGEGVGERTPVSELSWEEFWVLTGFMKPHGSFSARQRRGRSEEKSLPPIPVIEAAAVGGGAAIQSL